MKKDMMMSAEEQEFWEGYEAWLDEQPIALHTNVWWKCE